MRNFLCVLVLATFALAAPAFAQQSILLSGTTVPGHTMLFNNGGGYNPVAQDAGAAGGGAAGVGLSELNITARCTAGTLCASDGTGPNAEHFCIQDAPTTSTVGYHDLCFDANANGGNGLISFTAIDGATTAPLEFLINGVTYQFPGTFAPLASPAFTGTPTINGANVVATGTLFALKPYTVGTLPTCNTGAAGDIAYVTDATSPSYNATLAGSGTIKTLAFCNGTNWTAH